MRRRRLIDISEIWRSDEISSHVKRYLQPGLAVRHGSFVWRDALVGSYWIWNAQVCFRCCLLRKIWRFSYLISVPLKRLIMYQPPFKHHQQSQWAPFAPRQLNRLADLYEVFHPSQHTQIQKWSPTNFDAPSYEASPFPFPSPSFFSCADLCSYRISFGYSLKCGAFIRWSRRTSNLFITADGAARMRRFLRGRQWHCVISRRTDKSRICKSLEVCWEVVVLSVEMITRVIAIEIATVNITTSTAKLLAVVTRRPVKPCLLHLLTLLFCYVITFGALQSEWSRWNDLCSTHFKPFLCHFLLNRYLSVWANFCSLCFPPNFERFGEYINESRCASTDWLLA